MNIRDFIALSIQEIKAGIVSFNNDTGCACKASMPKEIEFDLAVHETKYGLEVIEYNQQSPAPEKVSRIKITVSTLNYAGHTQEQK